MYDLILRTVIVERHNASPNSCTGRRAVWQSAAQAEMAEALQEYLTEEELAVYRRGRNAKSYTTAKNASVQGITGRPPPGGLYGWLYLYGRRNG